MELKISTKPSKFEKKQAILVSRMAIFLKVDRTIIISKMVWNQPVTELVLAQEMDILSRNEIGRYLKKIIGDRF